MAQVRDVVCGMTIDSETAQHKSEYKGQTYYFCAAGCKRDFDQEPERYLEPYKEDRSDLRTFDSPRQ